MLETGEDGRDAGRARRRAAGRPRARLRDRLRDAPAPRPRRADQRRAGAAARRRGARAAACAAASRSAAWCRRTRASTCPARTCRSRRSPTGDRENLAFAVEHDVDYVALSFVRRAEDVEELRELIAGGRRPPRVIAKIEKAEAIEQLDAIVDVADGADGRPRRPRRRDRRRRRCRSRRSGSSGSAARPGKPVITATQMLESMMPSPEPTRAEASDVANAILDGTVGRDAVGRDGGRLASRSRRSRRWSDRARGRAEPATTTRPATALAARAALHLGRRRLTPPATWPRRSAWPRSSCRP